MHSLFGTVLWIVCGIGVLGAVAALLFSSKTWEEYSSRGRFMLDSDLVRHPQPASATSAAERDTEIRQLIEARNARAIRRGEPTVDVDAELKRLTAPLVDSGLRDEIRQLVIARNHRRVRAGKPPLDVDAEVEREIAGLSHLSSG